MLDLIVNNIPWIFSGVGIAIIAGVIALFRKKTKSSLTSDGSASINDTTIKGKNININIHTSRSQYSENHNVASGDQNQHTDKKSISDVNSLKIIDSFPRDGQTIRTKEVNNIFLKFNKPIDKTTACYIVNYFVKTNSICQWDTCGWIQYAEDDSKLIWHIKDGQLKNKDNYGPMEVDYHTFEIHVGRPPESWRVFGKDGSKLPLTILKVYIDKNDK